MPLVLVFSVQYVMLFIDNARITPTPQWRCVQLPPEHIQWERYQILTVIGHVYCISRVHSQATYAHSMAMIFISTAQHQLTLRDHRYRASVCHPTACLFTCQLSLLLSPRPYQLKRLILVNSLTHTHAHNWYQMSHGTQQHTAISEYVSATQIQLVLAMFV